jgi:TPR repeat protein
VDPTAQISVGRRNARRERPRRRAAAESGHGHAQLMLGSYLASGAAGKPNPLEARLWLERAVAQGVPDAETDLAEHASPARQK